MIFIISAIMPARGQDIMPSRSENIIPDDFFAWKDLTFEPPYFGIPPVWHSNKMSFYNYMGHLFLIDLFDDVTCNSHKCLANLSYWWDNGILKQYAVQKDPFFILGYPEEGNYRPDVLANPFMFEYNSALWYLANLTAKDKKQGFYECYAEVPLDTLLPWYTYVTHNHTVAYYKRGACQVGTDVFFLATLENPNDPNDGKWTIQVYSFDEKTKQFVHQSDYNLFDVKGRVLGGMFIYADTAHNQYIVLNTYDPGGYSYLGTITTSEPVKYTLNATFDYRNYAVTTMAKGTLKGQRNNPPGGLAASDRFIVFLMAQQQNSAHNNPVYYNEFAFQNTVPELIMSGEVILPSSSYPKAINKTFNMYAAIQYDIVDFSTEVEGPDGIRQHIWLYYPDSKKFITGARFESDIWRPIPGSVVSSSDLGDENQYGDSIRGLWSLVGIVDGAPPSSIDWHTWDSLHGAVGLDPTELKFSLEEMHKTEVAASCQDKYSSGIDMHFGNEKKVAAGVEFKYSNAFKEMHSSGTEIIREYTMEFGLNEESQEVGVFIWLIPQIKRISYYVYPWWDGGLQYPVANSLQYLFRTYGLTFYNENIDLSAFPFLIREPNEPGLTDWKVDERVNHNNDILKYDLAPFTTVSWHDPYQGGEGSFKEVKDTTSSYTSSNSYETTISASVGKPKIFSAGVSFGTKISYENETRFTTEFSRSLTVSLNNLTQKKLGVNASQLDISAYWFRPEQTKEWWYFDSLPNSQQPWYIAYIVNTCESRIHLLTPADNSFIKGPETYFSWETDGDHPDDLTFFIATSIPICASNTLYKRSVSSRNAISPLDSHLQSGQTYYWGIRGIGKSGDIIWSPIRAFSIKNDDSPVIEGGLNAIVYPNPSNQRNIYITVDAPLSGKILVSIFDITGRSLRNTEYEYVAPGPSTLMLNEDDLTPGIYFIVLHSEGSVITRKMIITR